MAKKPEQELPPSDPMVVIDLDGEQFTFPRDQDEWPTGAIVEANRVASGRSEYADFVEWLLGDEQWLRLRKLPFGQYKKFFPLLSEAMDELNGN